MQNMTSDKLMNAKKPNKPFGLKRALLILLAGMIITFVFKATMLPIFVDGNVFLEPKRFDDILGFDPKTRSADDKLIEALRNVTIMLKGSKIKKFTSDELRVSENDLKIDIKLKDYYYPKLITLTRVTPLPDQFYTYSFEGNTIKIEGMFLCNFIYSFPFTINPRVQLPVELIITKKNNNT